MGEQLPQRLTRLRLEKRLTRQTLSELLIERSENMVKVNKIKARMLELGYGMETLSTEIGIHISTLYKKLKKPDTFQLWELQKLHTALRLDQYQVFDIFFAAEGDGQ